MSTCSSPPLIGYCVRFTSASDPGLWFYSLDDLAGARKAMVRLLFDIEKEEWYTVKLIEITTKPDGEDADFCKVLYTAEKLIEEVIRNMNY